MNLPRPGDARDSIGGPRRPRRMAPILAAVVVLGAPAASSVEPPAPSAPPRILAPGTGQYLQPAFHALSQPGALPAGLHLAGIQVGSIEASVRLSDDSGVECTVRLGAPERPEVLARGRWLALLAAPDACRDAGPRVLGLLDGALPADPWIESSRSSPPPAPPAPTLFGPTAPRTLALATGAFGIVITLIAFVVAMVAAFRPRER